MTDRRSFLKGVLSLGVLSALPTPAFAALPTIYADGVHDDAPGLNAMFAGRQFHVESDFLLVRDGIIYEGSFLISNTIKITRPHWKLLGCAIEASDDFPFKPMLEVAAGVRDCEFNGLYVYGNDRSSASFSIKYHSAEEKLADMQKVMLRDSCAIGSAVGIEFVNLDEFSTELKFGR